ncbi:hepatocellular carcinoma-associated antigen 59-domain-containing protein [Sporodiniella umbellata]|nr:hepatocellular carcinoma-associated antigen 59-domain-containing protein [Sporodiniella umbellata]
MAIIKKQKSYRKKKIESDDDNDLIKEEHNFESSTIEEFNELRKLRRKQGGIDSERLSKGADKKKIREKKQEAGWSQTAGGLVASSAYRAKLTEEEDANKTKKLKLDSFTTQTNKLDVDKHMMEYIEAEMKKKKGYSSQEEAEEEIKDKGFIDIYEELYRLPDKLKGEQKTSESEGNVQLSSQMLTAIPEVDLGINTRLQNIEETERAKRKLYEETEREERERREMESYVPANFEKQIHREYKPRLDQRLTATDEQVVSRFKKRMRK